MSRINKRVGSKSRLDLARSVAQLIDAAREGAILSFTAMVMM